MINCSLFPSILKPLQRNQAKLPKFRIGDCVEFRSKWEDEEGNEGEEFWERGIIKAIIGFDWHWNTTKDEWLYYFEITEVSYGIDYQGAREEAFEDELTLIR